MRVLSTALHVIDNISEWSGKVISWVILPLTAIVVLEVTLRYVFNAPTIWVGEVATMLFGAAWFLGGAYALLHAAHVKMEVFYTRLSLKRRAILDLITAPVFFAFVGVLLWEGWIMVSMSLSVLERSNTMWGPPVYPYKMMIPLGASLILLQGLAKFIRDLITATTGKAPA